MNLIVCLEDRNGISFFGKRLSRDKSICERIVSIVGENKIFLTLYSAKLFENLPVSAKVCDEPLKNASQNDFCFIETEDVSGYKNDINTIIVYRFCRAYPFDKTFDTSLLSSRTLTSSQEFAGNSHDKIIEEVYTL